MLEAQVVVLAKRPRAGRTKTRLCPPLSYERAAQVARAALLDTLDAVAATPVRRRVVVLDGSPDDLVPAGFDVLPQRGDGLDERLVHAFSDTFADRLLPVLLIGMDTPQVTPELLEQCLRDLLAAPAVLGLADDGGWWAAGLHAADPEAFLGVPMSADDTGAHQLARFRRQGLEPRMLPALRDIDVIADLHAVAALMPAQSRTAGLLQVAP